MESPAVDQCVLIGQDKRHVGALVLPNVEYLKSMTLIDDDVASQIDAARKNGDDLSKLEEAMNQNAALVQFLKKEMTARNTQRTTYRPDEKIVDCCIVLDPFTVENGLMTQTLKIKKDKVVAKYAKQIQNVYH
mmetsp:Transcript_14991/g.38322  ORF Transcript_14991/g.38322 Transcript_14991/m.38322 type:complete len:133 (-) Transcript_14991:140-538(-)